MRAWSGGSPHGQVFDALIDVESQLFFELPFHFISAQQALPPGHCALLRTCKDEADGIR